MFVNGLGFLRSKNSFTINLLESQKRQMEINKKNNGKPSDSIKFARKEDQEKYDYFRSQIKRLKEDEERRKRTEQQMQTAKKIATGKAVDPQELEKLLQENPELYAKAMAVKQENAELKEKIKNAKSKEEVKTHIMNHIAKEIAALDSQDFTRYELLKEGREEIEKELSTGKLKYNKELNIDEKESQRKRLLNMGYSQREIEEILKMGRNISDESIGFVATI